MCEPGTIGKDMNWKEKLLIWSESTAGMIRLLDLILQGMDQSDGNATAYIQYLEKAWPAAEQHTTDQQDFQAAWMDAMARSRHIKGMIRYFIDLLTTRQLHNEPVEIDPLLREVVELLRPVFEQKRIIPRIDQNGGKGLVHTDRDYLRHTLTNLVDNALYATPEEGAITLAYDCSDPATARIEVSDTGPGIPEKNKVRIFQPFFSTKTVLAAGCGLGLTTAVLLMHRLRGSLDLDEEYRDGVRFIVRLPHRVE